jgi:hypothetical protein
VSGAEAAGKIDSASPLSSPGVKWSRPTVGPPGRIPLPGTKDRATAHVASEITAPVSMRSRLQLGAVHGLKVWLNGQVVYEGQPGTGQTQPDQLGVDVQLKEGVNRLLVQVMYQGDGVALYARFLDPDRKLKYAEGK